MADVTLRFLQYRACARLRWPCRSPGSLPWRAGLDRERPGTGQSGARACRHAGLRTSRRDRGLGSQAPLEPRLPPRWRHARHRARRHGRLVTPDGRVSDPLAGTPPSPTSTRAVCCDIASTRNSGNPPRSKWAYGQERGGGSGWCRAGGAGPGAEAFATQQVIFRQIAPALSGGPHFGSRSSSIPTGVFINAGDRGSTFRNRQSGQQYRRRSCASS